MDRQHMMTTIDRNVRFFLAKHEKRNVSELLEELRHRKICLNCYSIKDKEEYSKDNKAVDGLQSFCKACKNA